MTQALLVTIVIFQYYKEAVSKDDHVIGDTHVKPFALYELGLISAKVSQVRSMYFISRVIVWHII